MKLKRFISIVASVIGLSLAFLSGQASAYTAFSFEDWVYYDPTKVNTNCNETNYWTIYNQSTTCYRWFPVENDDNSVKSTIKLILDHNVGYDTYGNYEQALARGTANWRRYTGFVDIIDESTVEKIMKLDLTNGRPTLERDSVNGGKAMMRLGTNSMFYFSNGQKMQYAGFWTKDLYPEDPTYAYTITEYGNNHLVPVTASRGIRPVVEVDKNVVVRGSDPVDISDKISTARVYSYASLNTDFDGFNYRQLQGFTVARDKFLFHASNNTNSSYGVLFAYGGLEYSSLMTHKYDQTGHGNDLTYNSNTDEALLVGPNDYGSVWKYNRETLDVTAMIDVKTATGGRTLTAIGYDSHYDLYVGQDANRIYFLNSTDFRPLYSIDIAYDQTGQGIEYHNGYIYVSTYESHSGCPNRYAIYCYRDPGSAVVQVYNAKFDSAGNPSSDFGRRVAQFYINKDFGELETVSFRDNYMLFAFASRNVSNNEFTFREIDYREVSQTLTADVIYRDEPGLTTVTIKSKEQLAAIDGWTWSDNYHTLTSTYDIRNVNDSLTVCDWYANCSLIQISHENGYYDGYSDIDENGEPEVVPEDTETVQSIADPTPADAPDTYLAPLYGINEVVKHRAEKEKNEAIKTCRDKLNNPETPEEERKACQDLISATTLTEQLAAQNEVADLAADAAAQTARALKTSETSAKLYDISGLGNARLASVRDKSEIDMAATPDASAFENFADVEGDERFHRTMATTLAVLLISALGITGALLIIHRDTVYAFITTRDYRHLVDRLPTLNSLTLKKPRLDMMSRLTAVKDSVKSKIPKVSINISTTTPTKSSDAAESETKEEKDG